VAERSDQLMLFAEGPHASLFPQPETGTGWRMTVGSGLRCIGSWLPRGRVGLLLRMFLASSRWRSRRCALTWRVRGTLHGRLYLELYPLMPRTGDGEFLLLQTPTSTNKPAEDPERFRARALRNGYRNSTRYNGLEAQIVYGLGEGGDGRLNPEWLEWLMGFPVGWTEIER